MTTLQQYEMDNSRSNYEEECAKSSAPKRWSKVWDEFRLDKVTMKAICIHCNKCLLGHSKAGTSHLKRHLNSCRKRPYKDAAFGREVLSGERNMASVDPFSGASKHPSLTGEQREDDHVVEKQARINEEKQLKRPREDSGLISQGNILIGENNNLTIQLPITLALRYGNPSNLELGGVLKSFVTERLQLIGQKQQQEAQIKELKEALERAKAETREEKEARIAAEHKVSALTAELNEALERAKAETREEKEARVAAEHKVSALTAELKEALECAMAETREEKEARVAAKHKVSALTAELQEVLEHEKAETREEKEARVVAEHKVSTLTVEHKVAIICDEAETKEEKEAKVEAELMRDLTAELTVAIVCDKAQTREDEEASVAAEQEVMVLNVEQYDLCIVKPQIMLIQKPPKPLFLQLLYCLLVLKKNFPRALMLEFLSLIITLEFSQHHRAPVDLSGKFFLQMNPDTLSPVRSDLQICQSYQESHSTMPCGDSFGMEMNAKDVKDRERPKIVLKLHFDRLADLLITIYAMEECRQVLYLKQIRLEIKQVFQPEKLPAHFADEILTDLSNGLLEMSYESPGVMVDSWSEYSYMDNDLDTSVFMVVNECDDSFMSFRQPLDFDHIEDWTEQ